MGKAIKKQFDSMTRIYESDVEELTIQLLESIGYTYLPPEDQELERKDFADCLNYAL